MFFFTFTFLRSNILTKRNIFFGMVINYKIHTDVPQKYLSFLVYIHPTRQEPTYFHAFEKGLENKFKKEDTNPYEAIPWKVNTGYIFLANDLSLHSYSNTIYDTDRYVVLGNLINEV